MDIAIALKSEIRKKVMIQEDELQVLMKKLYEIGIRSVECVGKYAPYVEVEDLGGCIPLVMARVLIGEWKKEAAGQTHRGFSSVPYLQPKVDLDKLNHSARLFLNKGAITENEKNMVLQGVGDVLIEDYNLKENMAPESLNHVAQNIAQINYQFYDLGMKTVFVATSKLWHYIDYSLKRLRDVFEEDDGDDEAGPPAAKKGRKSAEVDIMSKEYGLKKVDYVQNPHTNANTATCIAALKTEYQKGPKNWNETLVSTKMAEIHLNIRYNLLNKNMSCPEARMEYPFLFERIFLMEYFHAIIGIDTTKEFKIFLTSTMKHAFNYFTRFGTRRAREEVIKVDRKIAHIRNEADFEPKLFATLMMANIHLSSGNGENTDDFIKVRKAYITNDEILADLTLPKTPILIALGDPYINNQFAVVIGGMSVLRITGFVKSLHCCFAAFYVFGACYPDHSSILWEFIQRVVFNLNPLLDGVSKRGLGKPAVSERVSTIANEIHKLRKMYEACGKYTM